MVLGNRGATRIADLLDEFARRIEVGGNATRR